MSLRWIIGDVVIRAGASRETLECDWGTYVGAKKWLQEWLRSLRSNAVKADTGSNGAEYKR
jgi:hypothetical protein